MTVGTGTYGGCGRIEYTPCKLGFDCADCGVSHSQLSLVGTPRRRLQSSVRQLPALGDELGFRKLLSTLYHGTINGTVDSYNMPAPYDFWLSRFDPDLGKPTRTSQNRKWRASLVRF